MATRLPVAFAASKPARAWISGVFFPATWLVMWFEVAIACLVLSREWGNGDYYWGLYRDYYKDPFPHSLLSTRE